MSEPVIEIENLTRQFKRNRALDNVSLTIPRGSVFGLIGENGAGKTTLMKHILGMLKAELGSVKVFGIDPVENPAEALGRIGYLSEDRDLPVWMRIDEYLNFRRAFFPKWDDDYARQLVADFNLDCKQKIGSLSRGQLARVGLIAAIAHHPDLLVLDEPSSGLDPAVRNDILSAIIRTVADDGRTVLFSSHLLDEVQQVSDYVALLIDGRLTVSEPIDDYLSRHTRWTLRLQQPLDQMPQIDGVINCSGDGLEWKFLCKGPVGALESWVNSSGAEVIDRATPALDEIFVDFLRPATNGFSAFSASKES